MVLPVAYSVPLVSKTRPRTGRDTAAIHPCIIPGFKPLVPRPMNARFARAKDRIYNSCGTKAEKEPRAPNASFVSSAHCGRLTSPRKMKIQVHEEQRYVANKLTNLIVMRLLGISDHLLEPTSHCTVLDSCHIRYSQATQKIYMTVSAV